MNGLVLIALLAASTAGDTAAADPAFSRLRWGDAAERPALDLRAASATRPETTSAPLFGAEDPAASGARFGIGVDYATDRLEALDVTAAEADLRSSFGVPPQLDDDATELRREMDLTLVGAQVPIALPRLGPFSIALVLEAAAVDGELELPVVSIERSVDPAANFETAALRDASFSGDGTLLGGGLELTAAPRSAGGPFLGLGYRFRTLRGFDLEPDLESHLAVPGELSSPLPGRLDRDEHQLTARLGWAAAGGRFVPYAGARAHRIETVVDGEILFRQARVPTRLELESEEVVGLAGIDVRLGGFVGRLEGTFGGDRETVLLKLVRGFGGSPGHDDSPGRGGRPAPRPRERTGDNDARQVDEAAVADDPTLPERRERARRLADELAPRVREIRQRFRAGRRTLETVDGPRGPVLDPGQVLALLDRTEADLLALLEPSELAPLRNWVEVFFDDLRDDLPETTVSRAEAPAVLRPADRPRPVFAALAAAQGPSGSATDRAAQENVLDRVGSFLAQLLARSEAGELTSDLCLQSLPEPGVTIRLFPPNYPQGVTAEVTERTVRVVYRGLYGYEVGDAGRDGFACRDRDCPLLDLWRHDGPFVVCNFSAELCLLRAGELEECRR